MSDEELSEFFKETSGRLRNQGVAIPDEELFAIFRRVVGGVAFLSDRFHKWWTVVKAGEIDVGNPSQAPYNLVVARFELKLGNLSSDVAFENGFIPVQLDSEDEKKALSECWNAAVFELRGDQMLELA